MSCFMERGCNCGYTDTHETNKVQTAKITLTFEVKNIPQAEFDALWNSLATEQKEKCAEAAHKAFANQMAWCCVDIMRDTLTAKKEA